MCKNLKKKAPQTILNEFKYERCEKSNNPKFPNPQTTRTMIPVEEFRTHKSLLQLLKWTVPNRKERFIVLVWFSPHWFVFTAFFWFHLYSLTLKESVRTAFIGSFQQDWDSQSSLLCLKLPISYFIHGCSCRFFSIFKSIIAFRKSSIPFTLWCQKLNFSEKNKNNKWASIKFVFIRG